MNIQLSISLLASDKPAALERCLDSLTPLLMQVPSELIVVATGIDQRIRDIAFRYTDQVIPFTWCNDFSAARNTGLKAAKGEWFLFLDDDEWFEDTTEIRDFFLSSEYKNYGTAYYKVRNYLNWDGIRYFDFHAFRMARITSSLCFQNSIHEEMVPRKGASKFFNSYVHHYGYVLEHAKTDTEKASRNVPMLLKAIRKKPNYIKNYIQLTQEYFADNEFDKAEEYCRKARRLCRGKAGADGYIMWLQIRLADIMSAKGDAEAAKKEITDMLEKEKPSELARLCLYSTLLPLCMQLEKHTEVLHYGKEFEELLKYVDANPRIWVQQSYGSINEMRIKKPEKLFLVRLRCTESALSLGNMAEAEYFLNLLPWEDEFWMQRYYSLFDNWKKEYGTSFETVLEHLSRQNSYLLFQKAKLSKPDEGNNTKLKQFLDCMEHTVSPYLRLQIIKEAVLSELDLSGFAALIDLDTWKAYVEQIIGELSFSDLLKIQKSVKNMDKTVSLHELWFEKLIREKRLIREYPTGNTLITDLSDYVQCILSYYKGQYLEELFQAENQNLLPTDCRFAILVAEALESIKEQRFPNAVHLLGSALHFHPLMTGVINEVIRHMKNSINNPALSADTEFVTLAAQMKNSLGILIEQGQYMQALPVMQKLCTLLPDDLELLRLRQRLLLSIK